jgi:hypothetical protein
MTDDHKAEQSSVNAHSSVFRPVSSVLGHLDRYFGLAAHGTDVRTEFLARLTTFLTMVYIVFVNPQILANAGMD